MKILFFPLLIVVVGLVYFLGGGDIAGATMLFVFGAAATFFMWILVPTFDHEGNTAPIDEDFTLPED